MSRRKQKKESLVGWKLVFWFYLAILMVFAIVKFDGNIDNLLERMRTYQSIRVSEPMYNINFVPLKSIMSEVRHWPEPWAVVNLVGNVVVFVPFGFLLPRSHRYFRNFITVMLISLVFISLVEVFQYVTLIGSCDVDDLILNMIGVFIGYILFLPFRRN